MSRRDFITGERLPDKWFNDGAIGGGIVDTEYLEPQIGLSGPYEHTLQSYPDSNELINDPSLEDSPFVGQRNELVADSSLEGEVSAEHQIEAFKAAHPGYIDGLYMWVASYLDEKLAGNQDLDFSDGQTSEDLRRFVETMATALHGMNPEYDIQSLHKLVVEALDYIEDSERNYYESKRDTKNSQPLHDEHELAA